MSPVLHLADYLVIALIVLVLASGTAGYLRPGNGARMARLERKVDLLLRQAGIAYDPKADASPEVLAALRQGNKIEAIKLYREATGVGLKEAKEFVEDLQRQEGI